MAENQAVAKPTVTQIKAYVEVYKAAQADIERLSGMMSISADSEAAQEIWELAYRRIDRLSPFDLAELVLDLASRLQQAQETK